MTTPFLHPGRATSPMPHNSKSGNTAYFPSPLLPPPPPQPVAQSTLTFALPPPPPPMNIESRKSCFLGYSRKMKVAYDSGSTMEYHRIYDFDFSHETCGIDFLPLDGFFLALQNAHDKFVAVSLLVKQQKTLAVLLRRPVFPRIVRHLGRNFLHISFLGAAVRDCGLPLWNCANEEFTIRVVLAEKSGTDFFMLLEGQQYNRTTPMPCHPQTPLHFIIHWSGRLETDVVCTKEGRLIATPLFDWMPQFEGPQNVQRLNRQRDSHRSKGESRSDSRGESRSDSRGESRSDSRWQDPSSSLNYDALLLQHSIAQVVSSPTPTPRLPSMERPATPDYCMPSSKWTPLVENSSEMGTIGGDEEEYDPSCAQPMLIPAAAVIVASAKKVRLPLIQAPLNFASYPAANEFNDEMFEDHNSAFFDK